MFAVNAAKRLAIADIVNRQGIAFLARSLREGGSPEPPFWRQTISRP
jgi:hypothetical protein